MLCAHTNLQPCMLSMHGGPSPGRVLQHMQHRPPGGLFLLQLQSHSHGRQHAALRPSGRSEAERLLSCFRIRQCGLRHKQLPATKVPHGERDHAGGACGWASCDHYLIMWACRHHARGGICGQRGNRRAWLDHYLVCGHVIRAWPWRPHGERIHSGGWWGHTRIMLARLGHRLLLWA